VAELEAYLARHGDAPEAPEAQALRVEALYRAERFADCVAAATLLLDAGAGPSTAARLRLARGRAALQSGQRELAGADARWLLANVASTDPAYVSATEVLAAVE